MRNSEIVRSRLSWLGAVLLLVISLASKAAPEPTTEARSQLAPAGKLRVGLLVTNRGYVTKDGEPADMQGVGVDLGRELARRLRVDFEPVRYRNVAALLEGARAGEWDVSPIGYAQAREKLMDFTPLYQVGRARYVVPTASALRSVEDIDKATHRVTVISQSVQEEYLNASLKQAKVVPTKNFREARGLMEQNEADAYFAGESTLSSLLPKYPEYRMLDGSVVASGNALAVAKGRPVGLAYASEFIEGVKASGFLQKAAERYGSPGLVVAPASKK